MFERRFYDFASTSTHRQPSDQIAIIAIDNESVANIGRWPLALGGWPWPRVVHAQLIDQLSAAKVKTIAHTVFFFEPQIDRGLVFIRQLKALLAQPDASTNPNAAQLERVMADAELALIQTPSWRTACAAWAVRCRTADICGGQCGGRSWQLFNARPARSAALGHHRDGRRRYCTSESVV